MYDPQVFGARCDVCPLARSRVGGPVPPEFHPNSTALIVGDNPNKADIEGGGPFSGKEGLLLYDFQEAIGNDRGDYSYIQVLPCLQPPIKQLGSKAPPRYDLELYLKQVKRKGEPSPLECCWPRFVHDIQASGCTNIIPMGSLAMKSILGTETSLMDERGGYREVDGFKVVPMLPPRQILRDRLKQPIFEADWMKAHRFFNDALQLPTWESNICPSFAKIQDFFKTGGRIVWDWETTRERSPMVVKPKCIGFYRDGVSLVVPWGKWTTYPAGEAEAIEEFIRQQFRTRKDITWVGHNSNYFDTLVTEKAEGAPIVGRQIDTLVLDALVHPGAPHDLGYVGTLITDFPSWKTDHEGAAKAITTEGLDLWKYNEQDVVVTGLVADRLMEECRTTGYLAPLDYFGGKNLVERAMWKQDFARRLHENGIWVDAPQWRRLLLHYQMLLGECKNTIDTMMDGYWTIRGFNPGSSAQMAKVLIDHWKLPPLGLTPTGQVAADSDTLRLYIEQGLFDANQELVTVLILKYRWLHAKAIGTYLMPRNPHSPDSFVWPDGRMHPKWNGHSVIVGRFSAKDPPIQTDPKVFRTALAAPPGHLFYGGDVSQIHLRIAAEQWNLPRLKEVFQAEGDPHALAAELIFGEVFTKDPGHKKVAGEWKGKAATLRATGKAFQFINLYGAAVPTVGNAIRSTQAEDGSFPFLGFNNDVVTKFREKYLEGMVGMEAAWERLLEDAVNNGNREGTWPFNYGPLSGRRRYYPGGPKAERSDIINAPVLITEQDIMDAAVMLFDKEVPHQKWGPGTGWVCQIHDAATGEAPAEEAPRLAKLFTDCLEAVTPKGWSIKIKADPVYGRTLKQAS